MPILDRSRREPKVNRRALLAGAPVAPQPEPAAEKPKKRATRKRTPKTEAKDE